MVGRVVVSGDVVREGSLAEGRGVEGNSQVREDGRVVVGMWLVGER